MSVFLETCQVRFTIFFYHVQRFFFGPVRAKQNFYSRFVAIYNMLTIHFPFAEIFLIFYKIKVQGEFLWCKLYLILAKDTLHVAGKWGKMEMPWC